MQHHLTSADVCTQSTALLDRLQKQAQSNVQAHIKQAAQEAAAAIALRCALYRYTSRITQSTELIQKHLTTSYISTSGHRDALEATGRRYFVLLKDEVAA